MKTFLSLTLIFGIFCNLQAEKVVELDPFVVKAHPMGYWDFSLFMHPIESDKGKENFRVKECEVLMTLVGGSSEVVGLRTGDRIIEVNGKKDWLKSEISYFFRNGDIGDIISLKVKRTNDVIQDFEVQLIDNPLAEQAITKLNGIEIRFPWGHRIMATNGKDDIYYLSQVHVSKEGKLLAKDMLVTKLSDPKYYFTPQDKKSHKIQKNRFIEFDSDLNYRIKKK